MKISPFILGVTAGIILTLLIGKLPRYIRDKREDQKAIERYNRRMDQLRKEKAAEYEKTRPPKYAAGSDIDSINRNAQQFTFQRKAEDHTELKITIALVAIVILIALALN